MYLLHYRFIPLQASRTMKLPLKSIRRRAARIARGACPVALAIAGCASDPSDGRCPHPDIPRPTARRPLLVDPLDSPSGLAVCYGPYREGQAPGGAQPTSAQLLEDLRLIARDFRALRLYSSLGPEREILRLIREHDLPLRVFVGAWIGPEARRDERGEVIEAAAEGIEANRAEVAAAIALAREFPEVVGAVIVGNETQVFWSGHRVDRDVLIGHIRAVREAVRVPVTTADDFNFWNKPESTAVAAEIDFIDNHAYAMWNGVRLEDAIAWTDERMREVRAAHPDHLVVLGETGWATRKHTEGDQAKYIKGTPGEREQAVFYEAIRRWAAESGTIVLYFEAFDEPWKGGAHPDEVEKHWGLYNADRTPKRALARLYERQAEWFGSGRIANPRGASAWILKDSRSPRCLLHGVQDGYNRKGLVSETGARKLHFDVLRRFYERPAAEHPDESSHQPR